jgi:hypothetical protein
MKLGLALANCFWLIVPLLAWNLVLGSRITQTAITSDAHSPKWLLFAENMVRILVFALPVFMPLPRGADWQSALTKAGLITYILGSLAYFGSWLPLLLARGSNWSNHLAGLLAPRLTPYLSFLGLALLGRSWLYGVIAAVFVFLHTWHGLQNN